MEVTFKKTEQSLYMLVNEPMSWSDSDSFATSLTGTLTDGSLVNAHLVSITSAEEQSVVSQWVQDNFNYNPAFSTWYIAPDGGEAVYVWLGGSDIQSEGNWQWSDGSAFTYTNWGTGALWSGSGQNSEPDDYNGQDALAMGLETWPYGYSASEGYGDPLQWNDIDENNLLPSVIEYTGDVARISIGNSHIAFDLDGNAGITARTLGAVFGAESVYKPGYVGIGLSQLDRGIGAEALMQFALNARLGDSSDSSSEIVDLLYSNIVGELPDESTKNYYMDLLDSGAYTASSLGIMAANTTLNEANINLSGLKEFGLDYILA